MKTTHVIRTLLLLAAAWLVSAPAFADAVFETLNGDVRVFNRNGALSIPARGQRVEAGASVLTGADGQALLRFDDGQAILLNRDSEFKITAYTFARDQPAGDSIVFDLLKGALRSVSGLIGSRNAGAYALHVPQATIGIRGTDFMAAIASNSQTYVSVQSGTITAANTAGTASFSAGSLGTVASATSLATPIGAADLPAGVATSFGSLSSVTVGAATGAGGAGGAAASGAATGGITGATVGAIVAGAAAAAALGSSSQTPASTSGTSGTTGTR